MTASRLSLVAEAVRPALKARLMLAAPSGAGKTKTGLIVATVLAADDDGSILVIDTEKESALTYADDFDFKHLPWRPPYDPAELSAVIAEAGRQFSVVMVDSTSHFWRKAGGTLDIADGKFGGWKKARPAQEDLVDAILGCGAHVILCARAKQAHVQETDERGRQVVKKLGMAAQQDDDLEYEMNIGCEMDMEHTIAVSKSRCDAVPVGRQFTAGHAGELAELYRDWLKVGEPPAPQAVVDGLVARMNALPADARKACKGEFVAELGRPELLREARLAAAEALVARFEGRGGGGGDEPSGSAAAPPPPKNAGGEGSPHESDGAAAEQAAGETETPTPTPSGDVTADQLLGLVSGAPATRKGKVQRAGVAVAQALGLPVPASIEDVIVDQVLAAAVLADLRGDDTPPGGAGGGQGPAVGEQPSHSEASDSGSPPAGPAPTVDTTDLVPFKAEHRSDWGKENARCQALAAEHLSGDPDTLKSQREALAWQASGGRVTSWAEVTRREFSQIRSWLEFIAGGHGHLVESDVAAHLGWEIRIDEGEAA